MNHSRTPLLLAALLLLPAAAFAQEPFHTSELIFPLEHWHNHASSIVELPGGDLFACWYHGSGERTADDVIIEAARLPKGAKKWQPRYTLADVPNFPDTNPALFLDSRERLWLLWPVIVANQWHTALMKYKISSNYATDPPTWEVSEEMLFQPLNFAARVREVVEPALERATPGSRTERYLREALNNAEDKYFRRMGWMTRAHPVELPTGRILVPLYSDGYSFSLIAITDDGGKIWTTSEPLVGWGSIQPTIVRTGDGRLVAFMRDNGPPPKRLHISTSTDDGVTWSRVVDSALPNPGSGAEAIVLNNGAWALIYNDTERGRHSLAVSISDDDGRTWEWTRHLELDTAGEGAGSFHYPSLIQAA
ncbi:MAG: neuraminidase (sialidase)-like protein, partial [bacterium]|nr:neuraminidase (sialidase)-like protein [bacterium]